ncbi:hypothetical protein [Haloarcula laminariae]|uniref:hypothetical protein n=1 Tax=Haloarcula laminariae TaxID=2961577 RepID=UPI0021C7631A|nr:hypothetical protein [Halomicroarcula laminariae]
MNATKNADDDAQDTQIDTAEIEEGDYFDDQIPDSWELLAATSGTGPANGRYTIVKMDDGRFAHLSAGDTQATRPGRLRYHVTDVGGELRFVNARNIDADDLDHHRVDAEELAEDIDVTANKILETTAEQIEIWCEEGAPDELHSDYTTSMTGKKTISWGNDDYFPAYVDEGTEEFSVCVPSINGTERGEFAATVEFI